MPGLSTGPIPPPQQRGVPSLRLQVAAGLHAAFLLARGRAEGVGFATLSPEGPARSFWAAALCLPAFLGLRLLGMTGEAVGTGPERSAVAELAGYVVSWAGFALVSHGAARRIGRADHWPRFIAAWNWCNVAQYLVLVLLLLSPSGPVGAFLGLAAFGYAMWLEWFVARVGLRLSGAGAAGIVALDLALSLLVAGLVEQISRS